MASDKKGAEELGAYIIFIDESGFMLIGTVCRTWAPCGRTPAFYYWYKHDKVSVISGLSVSPRQHRVGLYYRVHEVNIRRLEVCHFLRHLMRHLRGHIVIIWDNGPIHKGDEIREFLARHPRLHVERFPGYAPELNPDEGVWDQTKKAMANGRPKDVGELRQQVHRQLRRLRRSQPHLRACFHHSHLPSFLKNG